MPFSTFLQVCCRVRVSTMRLLTCGAHLVATAASATTCTAVFAICYIPFIPLFAPHMVCFLLQELIVHICRGCMVYSKFGHLLLLVSSVVPLSCCLQVF